MVFETVLVGAQLDPAGVKPVLLGPMRYNLALVCELADELAMCKFEPATCEVKPATCKVEPAPVCGAASAKV